MEPHQLITAARAQEPGMLRRIRALVEVESPSENKAAVDEALSTFSTWGQSAGGELHWHRHARYGDSLELRFSDHAATGVRPILLLGHLDTVWPLGTLVAMPWSEQEERVSGPGVLDMKAGAVMALTAIEIVRSLGNFAYPVTLLLHGDEEVGSPASRRVTEEVARRSAAVYVLEPAQGPLGAYKTARKAVGMYRLSVQGVAAHSGVDFEQGQSAVLELAFQIERLSSMTDLSRGITVNPGVIGGGTQSNVVAAEAWVEVDVRLERAADVEQLDRAFRGLVPRNAECRLTVTGGINRPPMERTASTVALFEQARRLASELGIELAEAATGGGSDGNFTSALGVPTLDGMGAVGAGAHARSEHIVRAHLAPRTALLAAMLLQLPLSF